MTLETFLTLYDELRAAQIAYERECDPWCKGHLLLLVDHAEERCDAARQTFKTPTGEN